MPKDKLIFDRPSVSKLYNDLIAVLSELTGITWGFVSARTKVKWITSAECPLKIIFDAKFSRLSRWTPDIRLQLHQPGQFATRADWRAALKTEVWLALMDLPDQKLVSAESHQPSDEYSVLIMQAREQNIIHGFDKRPRPAMAKFDVYHKNCIELGFG